MQVSSNTRNHAATVMMVVGGLLTLSVVGMAWGVPLLMWGWDIRRRIRNEEEAEGGGGTAALG